MYIGLPITAYSSRWHCQTFQVGFTLRSRCRRGRAAACHRCRGDHLVRLRGRRRGSRNEQALLELPTFRRDAGVSVTANTSLFRTGVCLSWAVGGPRLRKHSRPSRYHPSPPFLWRNDMLRQRTPRSLRQSTRLKIQSQVVFLRWVAGSW